MSHFANVSCKPITKGSTLEIYNNYWFSHSWVINSDKKWLKLFQLISLGVHKTTLLRWMEIKVLCVEIGEFLLREYRCKKIKSVWLVHRKGDRMQKLYVWTRISTQPKMRNNIKSWILNLYRHICNTMPWGTSQELWSQDFVQECTQKRNSHWTRYTHDLQWAC